MRFLLDENLSPLHARTVRGMGHDAVSVVEIGLAGAGDEEVRAAAIGEQRVLLTLDADFANVLRYPPAETPGVVRLRLHPATEQAIDEMLVAVIPRVAEVSVRGKLLVVDGQRIRVRGQVTGSFIAAKACLLNSQWRRETLHALSPHSYRVATNAG